MSESRFFETKEIVQLWLECDSHEGKTPVPVAHFSTEDRIANFFHEHTHLSSSSPAGMKDDMDTLSKLLRRLATADIMQIAQIAERHKLRIGFEIRDTGRTDEV